MKPSRHLPAFLASIAVVSCHFALSPARAVEEISNQTAEIRTFHADIQVLPDGTLEVTESIRFWLSEGTLKWGLTRHIPLVGPFAKRAEQPVSLQVLSIKRSGKPEPFRLTRTDDQARLLIGRGALYLEAPAEHHYEIRYRTQGQIQFLEGYDQLAWRVTGDHWAVPIRSASVTISLPNRAPILREDANTGSAGTAGIDVEVGQVSDGVYRAKTARMLAPGESFAVNIAWQAGSVAVPEEPEEPQTLLLPHNWAAPFAPTLLGGLVLLACKFAVGRNPNPGVISPEFEPPDSIGPAEARYILEQGYDDRCLAAAIANMAVKGALRIEEEPSPSSVRQSDFRLVPLGKKGKGLTVAERAIYGTMFPRPDDLTLTSDSENGRRVDRARSTAASWLIALYDRKIFAPNPACTLAGGALAVAAAAVLPYVSQDAGSIENFFSAWFFTALYVFFAALLLGVTLSSMRTRSRSAKEGSHLLFWYLLVGFFCISIVYFIRLLLQDVRSGAIAEIELAAMGSGALFSCLCLLLIALKAAPTRTGRRLMDRLQGFALYLRTTEEERLKFFGRPENTPERLERLRPYVIALGDPDAWTEEFALVLGSASGSHWSRNYDSFHIYRIDQSLIDAVEAAVEREAASNRRQRR